jgi:hypothetical protein
MLLKGVKIVLAVLLSLESIAFCFLFMYITRFLTTFINPDISEALIVSMGIIGFATGSLFFWRIVNHYSK